MKKIKKIKQEYKKNGYVHKLIKRHGNVALFSLNKNDKEIAWEVIKIRKRKITSYIRALDDSYKDYDYIEILPSNEEFGIYGWSLDRFTSAIKLFYEKTRGTK